MCMRTGRWLSGPKLRACCTWLCSPSACWPCRSAVWTTCLVFFQALLLLGYVYAHWSMALRPKTQGLLHLALLAISLLALPICSLDHLFSVLPGPLAPGVCVCALVDGSQAQNSGPAAPGFARHQPAGLADLQSGPPV